MSGRSRCTRAALTLVLSVVSAVAAPGGGSASALTAAQACTHTYAGSALSMTAEPGEAFSTHAQDSLTVPTTGSIADIDVRVSGTFQGTDGWDPEILFGSSAGAVVTLAEPTAATYDGVVFDDSASSPAPMTGNLTGRYRPSYGTLATFRGKPTAATYTLELAFGTASITSWSITLRFAGCATTSRISIRRSAGTVRGAVSSAKAFCRASRAVTVYRVRSGVRSVLSRTRTSATGAWHVTAPKRRGTSYLATVAPHARIGTYCRPATSTRVA